MYNTRVLVVALLLVLAATLVAALREHHRREALGDGPDTVAGRPERCLVCHDAPHQSPGDAHSAAAVGCSSCHLGDPISFRAEAAHRGMEPAPGALGSVDRTCGREACHPRETGLVRGSLMATGRGIVAVDRWVFGEQPTPDGTTSIREVLSAADPSPADSHLARLCAGCHLHASADNRDDAIPEREGVGCSACHLAPTKTLGAHPAVTARVADDRCLGCHSRSGRIALSYQGLAEILPGQTDRCDPPTALHDGRPACRVAADVHRERGMSCIDCHLHTDLMGDGTAHRHEEEQVEITCEACHDPLAREPDRRGTPAPKADPITEVMLRLRDRPAVTAPLRRGRRGTPLWNLERDAAGTGLAMIGKYDGAVHALPATPDDPNHRLAGHDRLSCTSCHAAWAPTCTTCHTSFDADKEQWDFARAAVTPGAWVEKSDGYTWRAPTLAVDARDRVVPAIPGMVMTLEQPDGTRTDHRLYAALDPHTTTKEARSCDSCHRSSVALGLGEGTLDVDVDPPRFVPATPDPASPARAADGWTTLGAPAAIGTRDGLRSLDAAEQQRVLAVGRCTPCHGRADDPIYVDFAAAQRRRTRPGSRCKLSR